MVIAIAIAVVILITIAAIIGGFNGVDSGGGEHHPSLISKIIDWMF